MNKIFDHDFAERLKKTAISHKRKWTKTERDAVVGWISSSDKKLILQLAPDIL